ncbi:EamA family transporter [Nocardia pseudovaccinii]|uniref:EamA family transporter n=1 Tax=Nocardia pseudovaccinii TaxID=189540 RepID=UPI003D8CDAAA
MAVTLDFLGPLTVAVIASRRPRDLMWTLVAGLGVLLMMMKTGGSVSWTGVLFAIAAGAGWGAYITCSEVVGRHTSGHDGLALAMAFGGLLVLPVAFANASPALFDPLVLAALAVVAVLSSLVPHAIELEALRRISAATVGVLMSLEPAVAAAAGLLCSAKISRSFSAPVSASSSSPRRVLPAVIRRKLLSHNGIWSRCRSRDSVAGHCNRRSSGSRPCS